MMILFFICLGLFGAMAEPSSRDFDRAYQRRPFANSHVAGPHPASSFSKMNTYLSSQAVDTRTCEELTHDQLNSVYLHIFPHMDQSLNTIYAGRGDRREAKFSSDYYVELWQQEAARIQENGEEHGEGTSSYTTTRDGKCAETVMWWIHHLSESAQTHLAASPDFFLPLMPAEGPVESDDDMYIYQISCSDCHTSPNAPEEEPATAPTLPQHNPGDGNCPIDPSTGLPTVWYQNDTLIGQRRKRCDWDYDPPCRMCEGVGGLVWGDQEHQIKYAQCTPMMEPDEIPRDNLTSPLWPKEFTVDESTILINQINTGGRFPGADPCAPHKFQNQTETQYYDGFSPQSHIHTYGLLDTSDIWALADGNMYIKIEKVYCICVTPRENGAGSVAIGPLRYDFASDAVLIGREKIEIEFQKPTKSVVADHWIKGPHHFWIEVATNRMIRGWQPYNGLNVYYNWDLTTPDPSKFVVDKSCYSGFLHNNISCIAGPPKYTP